MQKLIPGDLMQSYITMKLALKKINSCINGRIEAA